MRPQVLGSCTEAAPGVFALQNVSVAKGGGSRELNLKARRSPSQI